jgi:hypothetical protein
MRDWPCELGDPLVTVQHQYALGYEIRRPPSKDLSAPLRAWTRRKADGKWKSLSHASKLDRIIWDLIVVRRNFAQHCDALTLLTEEIEFDALLFWGADQAPISKITYFPVAPGKIKPQEDRKYWVQAAGEPLAQLKGLEKWFTELVVWNCYKLDAPIAEEDLPTRSGAKKVRCLRGVFSRSSLVFRDSSRKLFLNVPVPSKPIFIDLDQAKSSLNHEPDSDMSQLLAVRSLYNNFRETTECWVTAVGSPMARNLESLSALLLDESQRVTLVTGLPGTGKEGYAKALHFATRLLGDSKSAVFLTTTALDLSKSPGGPMQWFREQKAKIVTRELRNITFFIDELNKVHKHEMFSELLRVLEDPNGEMDIPKEVRINFVLAASEHLDELTKRPSPQDFWTRISHQLRVVHPLAHVSEKDAQAFLRGYFLYEWCKLVYETVGANEKDGGNIVGGAASPMTLPNKSKDDFIEMMFGRKDDGELAPSSLCESILHELIGTLVPLVTRDSLSVRGVRSMVGQVFARVLSHARYVSEQGDTPDGRLALAIVINRAIQDVLAVLNAARGVPRSGGSGHDIGAAPV